MNVLKMAKQLYKLTHDTCNTGCHKWGSENECTVVLCHKHLKVRLCSLGTFEGTITITKLDANYSCPGFRCNGKCEDCEL